MLFCVKVGAGHYYLGNQGILLDRKLTLQRKIIREINKKCTTRTLGSPLFPFSRSGAMAFKSPQRAFPLELGKVGSKFVCLFLILRGPLGPTVLHLLKIHQGLGQPLGGPATEDSLEWKA